MYFSKTFSIFFLFTVIAFYSYADVIPFALFQDGAVLQQGKMVPVWGKADPDEPVTVSFIDVEVQTIADAKGNWRVVLPPFKTLKTPSEMIISGKNKITIKDIVIGEVFFTGGQSNMEVPVKEALNPEHEAANAYFPLIREFKVEHDFAFEPQDTLNGKWTAVSPETAADIGAVGYYFARELQKTLDVPIGLINNSYSGSPAEAWVSIETLRADPAAYRSKLSPYDKYAELGRDGVIRKRDELGESFKHSEPESYGEMLRYHELSFNDAGWKDFTAPGWLETVFGEVDGLFWFRRTLDLPEEYAGKPLVLKLGVVDDTDVTYFNGVKVGETTSEVKDSWNVERVYDVPGELVKKGKNVIAVRCFDSAHAGGLPGPEMTLVLDENNTLDLSGVWKCEFEQMFKPRPWPADYLPLVKIYHAGSVLYNAMFAPFKDTPAVGILWYQGESNAESAKQYEVLFKELIKEWRASLGDDKMPFLFVQLAAYQAPTNNPNARSTWAELRAAQEAALELPFTYMVPAIDIGDAKNIHPLNKQEVGRRLALTALQNIYKLQRNVIAFPKFKNMFRDGDKLTITFDNANGLMTADGKAPNAFAIAGKSDDLKFYQAEAVIENDRIILHAADVPEPFAVRYAWSDNPEVNTVNDKGFPVLPFKAELPAGAVGD